VRIAAKPIVGEISERLKALGVVVADAQARKAIALPLVVAAIPLALGGIKIYLGVMRDKPVGFLVALGIITLIATLVAFARRPLRSRLGDVVLKRFQSEHESLKSSLASTSIDPLLFAMGVGLFGMAALDNTPWNSLKKDLQPPGGFSSGCGSSCGSSCGGGCGGGGCGGCGGGD
jgi:uncharacterized protein (TIGR04222 family)